MATYYPDLASVQDCVNAMRKNKGDKRYNGIYPETEEQLPQARQELGKYFRLVWNDKVGAMEVELAVSRETYHEKMRDAVLIQLLVRSRNPVKRGGDPPVYGRTQFPFPPHPIKFDKSRSRIELMNGGVCLMILLVLVIANSVLFVLNLYIFVTYGVKRRGWKLTLLACCLNLIAAIICGLAYWRY